jgi:SSS family solute:Na+ symporter
MDYLQLVFGFVNAPLFATFALGMFWRKATANGAFWGLLSGTIAAALTHGLTLAEGKGAWLGNVHEFSSSMSQNFMIASIAWLVCFVATYVISLFTARKDEKDLVGLVYSLTPRPEGNYKAVLDNPMFLAAIVIALTLALNLIFL